MNKETFAPLTPEEISNAVSKVEKIDEDEWTPIVPVPDNAPNTNLKHHRLGFPDNFYTYRDPFGAVLFYVCRFDTKGGKQILPYSFCESSNGRREWRWKGIPALRPLFGLVDLRVRQDALVLVTEGEKAAIGAADLLPELVIVTSPGGAKAAGKADWAPLSGRAVVIWPDADEPGRAYAADVARLALDAGAASVAVVTVPEDFPAGWDLADPIPEGWDTDRLHDLLATAAEVKIEPTGPKTKPTSNPAASPFRMTATGLWFVPEGDEDRTLVAGPFEIVAETRDEHSNSWGVLLEWRDHDGRLHQWALPRSMLAGDAADVRARLLDGGLYVAPSAKGRQMLTTYLASVRTEARARCVDQTGWQGNAYVTPGRVFGDTGGELLVMQTAGQVADFDQRGTLEGWQQGVARLAIGNSRVALALSAAFAGALLALVGEESFGFHFSGKSSSGKTTALHAASSAWGIQINTWRTTDNAAEGMARAANDGLLLLDELSQVDGKAADAMTYMLGNGQGKGRMRRDATTKPVAVWRLVFLSTGELGLAEKIGEAGKKARAGQSVRMIEIPADAGAGHKLFEVLHGHPDGDALAKAIKAAAEKHRGHAIRQYLEQLTAAPSAIAAALKEEMADWLSANLPAGADGQVSRVAARFALVAAAGKLATGVKVLLWPDEEASNAAAICFKAWLDMRGGAGAAETEAGLAQVRAFIELHGSSRFVPLGESGAVDFDQRTAFRTGFRRRDTADRWEYLVLPEAWKAEVCKGLDARAVARDLIARKLIIPGADGKASRAERLPGVGQARFYLVSGAILEGGAA